MCNWFSCISDGKGNMFYFNTKQREQIIKRELRDKTNCNAIDNPDSHSSLSAYYGLDDDKVNKYEFRPLDRYFIVDQINNTDDKTIIEKKIRKLNFKKLVPSGLIFKKLVCPFKHRKAIKVTKKDIVLLKEWDSVRDSVWDSVRDSVWASVWDSVRDSVWDSVRDSVRDSVWDSVRDSVRDLVWDSVWASVRDSSWAYTSSFFNLKKWAYVEHEEGVNPFQSCIDLWERGIMPVFDGQNWHLFGYKGKLLKTISKKELKQ